MTVIGIAYTPTVLAARDNTTVKIESLKNHEKTTSRNDALETSHKKGIPSSAIKIAGEVTLAIGNGISHSPKIINHSSQLISKGVPKTVGLMNYGIGIYDSYDFIKKASNKDVSFTSKAFAAGTVALDVVSIVAHTKGNGKIAMAAGLVSIGTSVMSDKYK